MISKLLRFLCGVQKVNSEPEICELDRACHHEAGHAVIAHKYEKTRN